MAEELDYNQLMRQRILDIEAIIGEHLSKESKPELIVGSHRSIEEILEWYKLVPDWKDPKGCFLGFGDDDDIVLRIIRTVDLPYGVIIIR